MPSATRTAEVVWQGDLARGSGRASLGTGAIPEFGVSWPARTEQPGGKTSPEELIAAALASCYSMALSATLGQQGSAPDELRVRATSHFEKRDEGWRLTTMDLRVRGRVPGIDAASFEEAAQQAGRGCPVSNALRNNVDIRVDAALE